MRWHVKIGEHESGPLDEQSVTRLLRAGAANVLVRPEDRTEDWKSAAEFAELTASKAYSPAAAGWNTAGSTHGGSYRRAPPADLAGTKRDQRSLELNPQTEAQELLAPHADRIRTFVQVAYTQGQLVDEYGDADANAFAKQTARFLGKLASVAAAWPLSKKFEPGQIKALLKQKQPRAVSSEARWHARSQTVLWAVVQQLHRELEAYVARLPQRADPGVPMGGTDFELCVLAWLRAIAGVEGARQIGQSGDCGGDILFDVQGSRVVVQAKSYSGKVGSNSVQEVFTAKQNYACGFATVVTNSEFTLPAQRLAKRVGVRLVERASPDALRRLVDAIRAEANGA